MAFLNETGLHKLWEQIDNKFARNTELQASIEQVQALINYVESQIPTALKNPNKLTIKGNGTQSFTYDGSSAKTLNIKPGDNISVSSDTSGNITISFKNKLIFHNSTTSLPTVTNGAILIAYDA